MMKQSYNNKLYTSVNKQIVFRIFDTVINRFIKSGSANIYSKQASVWTTRSACTNVIKNLPEELKIEGRLIIKEYKLDE